MEFVVYDIVDGTAHCGGGHWSNRRGDETRYFSPSLAMEAIRSCDPEKILGDRLCVMRVEKGEPFKPAGCLIDESIEADTRGGGGGG